VLAKAISVLGSQPAQPSENPTEAIEAAHVLEALSTKIIAYLSQKGDLFVTEAVRAAGSETGKWATRLAIWTALAAALSRASAAALAWIHSLPW
jgi:hypothetical protein